MPVLTEIVRRIRPAPVASAVAGILGLSTRRVIETRHGRFFANPVSRFGHKLSNGEYEPATTAILTRYLASSQVFVDLGANEGYFSVIASRLVGQAGRVFAIEPQSRLQSVIHANFALNNCTNIHLINAVISDRSERVLFHLASPLNNGGSSIFRHTRYPLRREEVQSLTLGEFLTTNGIVRCDLMKVDIEGGEYEVFMNSVEVLKTGIIKRIALDIHHSLLERRGLSGKHLHDRISECGYSLSEEQGIPLYTFDRHRG